MKRPLELETPSELRQWFERLENNFKKAQIEHGFTSNEAEEARKELNSDFDRLLCKLCVHKGDRESIFRVTGLDNAVKRAYKLFDEGWNIRLMASGEILHHFEQPT